MNKRSKNSIGLYSEKINKLVYKEKLKDDEQMR